MSDLCMYEFEDIAWDDLCLSDDHTVPHPLSEKPNDIYGLVESQNKQRGEELTSLNTQDKSATGYVYQTSECGKFASLSERSKMLENGLFSPSLDRDSTQEASCVASEDMSSSHVFESNNTDSNGNEFCMNVDDKVTTTDKNSFSCPLADANHTENNLDTFENSGARDSGDLLYYDWPEIGNFEDVDRMFRSCDSTFGLEGSKDGFGWLSSADDVGESKDEMKSDSRFFTMSGNSDYKSITINDPATTCAPNVFKDNFWIADKSESYLSFVDGASLADREDGFTAGGQIANNRNQSRLQKHSTGKRKEHHSANGSFSYVSNLSNETTQDPSKATSLMGFSSGAMQQHQNLGPDSYGYLQNPFTYVHSGSSCLSGLKLANQSPSALKSEILTSRSPRDSSGLSKSPYTTRFGEPLQQVTVPETTGKREKLRNRHSSQSSIHGSPKDTSVRASISDSTKRVQLKFENHTDAEGVSQTIPAELGSSNVRESPTGRFGMEDNSMEAASFRQLQLVMEQLDLKTKLCIRDSLYRLARSAEQRHNHANVTHNGDEIEGNGALVAKDASNFMDMEKETNPIDRSIAHLLFHRAPESSVVPPHELLRSNLPSAVQGSIVCPSTKEENMVICKETASGNGESG